MRLSPGQYPKLSCGSELADKEKLQYMFFYERSAYKSTQREKKGVFKHKFDTIVSLGRLLVFPWELLRVN